MQQPRSIVVYALLAFMCLQSAAAVFHFDFVNDNYESCDPVESVLMDPRATGIKELLEAYNLTQLFRDVWEVSGGTIVMPTARAWDDFLEEIGVESMANLTSVVSVNAWKWIIPSYFLTNRTNLPKDVSQIVYQTPSNFLVLMGAYASNETDQAILMAQYVAVQPDDMVLTSADIQSYGTPAQVVDWSLVCQKFALYWVDSVFLPESEPCRIAKPRCPAGDSSAPSNGNGGADTAGRRLLQLGVSGNIRDASSARRGLEAVLDQWDAAGEQSL